MSAVIDALFGFILRSLGNVADSAFFKAVVALFLAQFVWLITMRLIRREY